MRRAALVAGVSIATLLCVGSTKVWAAWNSESWWGNAPAVLSDPSPVRKSVKPRSRPTEKSGQTSDKAAPIPTGVLHIIVSIDKQRATLFADGVPFASTAMSSGTPGHPTPTGVFTIIQKSRHHVSNLYNASMPYMQRITWSGSALHQGPLPGYPASHGCVRLTEEFAQLLWKTTKMGARVIVTRPEVAPMEFNHTRMFVPRPKMVEAQPKLAEAASQLAAAQRAHLSALANPATTAAIPQVTVAESSTAPAPAKVKTADAANSTAVAVTSLVGDASKPIVTSIVTDPVANVPAGEQSTKLSDTNGTGSAPATVEPVEAQSAETKPAAVELAEVSPPKAAAVEIPLAVVKSVVAVPALTIIIDERPKEMPKAVVQEANGRPISVFASLKEGKLYVRQGWKPLFDAPISFENPGQPVGTHVYTAMGMKADGKGMRWTVVSIPSNTRRIAELKDHGRKSRSDHLVKAVEVETPLPSPSDALDRIVMAPELIERISELMTPGSSLIVSDNKLSDETGEYTDFIVLTR